MARNLSSQKAEITGPRTILVNNFVEEIRAKVPN
jgi:hypothetical protein